jgi:hypothetical protein
VVLASSSTFFAAALKDDAWAEGGGERIIHLGPLVAEREARRALSFIYSGVLSKNPLSGGDGIDDDLALLLVADALALDDLRTALISKLRNDIGLWLRRRFSEWGATENLAPQKSVRDGPPSLSLRIFSVAAKLPSAEGLAIKAAETMLSEDLDRTSMLDALDFLSDKL